MRIRRSAALLATTALALGGVLVTAAPAHAAPLVVNSTADDLSVGTLRWAITQSELSAGADDILFDPAVLDGQTIQLSSTLPTITQPLSIDASTLDLTITRSAAEFSIFTVDPATADAHFTLLGLLFDGAGSDGRAIDVVGGLQPIDVSIIGSSFTGLDSGVSGGAVRVTDVRSLRVQDATFTGNGANESGGGLAAFGIAGEVAIVNTEMSQNSATNGGGAVALSGIGGARIEGSRFEENDSGDFGGAVSVVEAGAGLTVSGSLFLDNVTGDTGGAMYIDEMESVAISTTTFETNSASGPGAEGGAVYADDIDATFSVVDTIFDGNFVDVAGGGYGGGLYFLDSTGTLTIEGSLFQDNESGSGGGLALNEVTGAATVTSTTFFSNEVDNVDGEGAGILVAVSPGGLTVVGSSFNQNQAARGGAISAPVGAPLTIQSTEFVANDALDGAGGALWLLQQASDDTRITASQFRDNTSTQSASAIQFVDPDGTPDRTIVIDSTTILREDGSDSPLVDFANLGDEGSVEVVNSTIDAGEGATGSALDFGWINEGFVSVRHSTIVGDEGIWISLLGSNAVSVANTAFSVDTDVVTFDARTDEAFRVHVSWSAATVPVDPAIVDDLGGNRFDLSSLGLGDLAENGGTAYLSGVPMLTRLPEPGSVLINTGQSPTGPGTPAFDERGSGFDRVSNGRLDIGAVEVQVAALPATGGTIAWWAVVAGIVVLVLGVGALIFARLRGRRSPSEPEA